MCSLLKICSLTRKASWQAQAQVVPCVSALLEGDHRTQARHDRTSDLETFPTLLEILGIDKEDVM
jgi:hypothetical protein